MRERVSVYRKRGRGLTQMATLYIYIQSDRGAGWPLPTTTRLKQTTTIDVYIKRNSMSIYIERVAGWSLTHYY